MTSDQRKRWNGREKKCFKVIASKYDHYRLVDQWTSYGWNVFTLDDGNDYDQVVAALKTMDDWDPKDRRPMVVLGKTVKGYWPYASHGNICGHHEQIIGYASHPYALKMNSDYFFAAKSSGSRHVARVVLVHGGRTRALQTLFSAI